MKLNHWAGKAVERNLYARQCKVGGGGTFEAIMRGTLVSFPTKRANLLEPGLGHFSAVF